MQSWLKGLPVVGRKPIPPYVYLVGAGPGDPGLLTMRAIECLSIADTVIYDYLASSEMLAFAPQARKIAVSDLPGEHPNRWPHIHERIVQEALAGNVVVHLKGGDPSIFGRCAEEVAVLQAANIPYEIVPGVTSASAASAYGEIPLTHRAHASAVAFITGHEYPGKEDSHLSWEALAQFPGTLVVYMGVARIASIAASLQQFGKSPTTPVAVVQQASSGSQRRLLTTLQTVANEIQEQQFKAPAIIFIGPAVGAATSPSWFERKPLAGKKILITRPAHQVGDLLRQLELAGAAPSHLPVLDIVPTNQAEVDREIRHIARGLYDGLIFTSRNTVDLFFARLRALKYDARTLAKVQIASIGPATTAALAEHNISADITTHDESNSEALLELLRPIWQGKRILLPQAAEARTVLHDGLKAFAEQVQPVVCYQQEVVLNPKSPVFAELRKGDFSHIHLMSGRTAEVFLAACDEEILIHFRSGRTVLVANSARLYQLLTEKGFVCLKTPHPQADGLLELLLGE
ncbi:MAG: uroporphyrinogen-III C-methyltransferase [Zavarzinella sp.]